ncbi:MAG: nitroreductase [Spongiibacteraceae bacterium]
MSVITALQKRVSTRAFLSTPLPRDLIQRTFTAAQLAPSNCNVQPWQVYVVSGDTKQALQEKLLADIAAGKPAVPEFDWSLKYEGELRERQFGSASALYGALGIDRKDREARDKAMLRNWSFFDAPHVAFFTMDKSLGLRGAVDLGIYAQSLALLMADAGIATCMQGALGQHPGPVRAVLNIPDHLGILFGMSFGYADPNAPANTTRTVREPLEKSVIFAN